LVLAVWLAGCLGWWALAAYRIGRFRQLFLHATPAAPVLREQVQHLARRLGLAQAPDVWLVPAPISPLLWGLGRSPCLLLPAALWQRLPPGQQETLLAHELAHLRRRDHWVRLLELVALGLYWWHPVAWWARHALREAEEQCCDAWVVWALPAAAPAYAAALVETVAFLSRARAALPLAASGIGHVHTLKRRLTMILRGTPPRALSGAGFLAVLGLGALLLPLLPTRAAPAGGDKPDPRPGVMTGTAPGADEKPKPDPKAATDQPAPEKKPRPDPKPAPDKGTTPEKPRPDPKAHPEKPSGAEKPKPKTRAPSPKGDHAEQLEQAKDEVEILKAQLDVKRAEVTEAKARLNQAGQQLKRLQALVARRGAAKEELTAAQTEVEVRAAQLKGKQAYVVEAEIRLKQAVRRLARLRKGPADRTRKSEPKSGGGKNAADPRRLRELEKKLDALLREVNALRREIRPAKSDPNLPRDRPKTDPKKK
jgi:outer membrane biosynthesis protein TonB